MQVKRSLTFCFLSLCIAATTAQGQDNFPLRQTDEPFYYASTTIAAEDDSEKPDASEEADSEEMDNRVAALEKQLKKITEAESKKKSEDSQKPAVKPRLRLHTDANWFDQSQANRATVGDIQDGTFIRRARMGFDAKAFEITEYRLDFEMASGGGRPSIFDAYGKLTSIPVLGNVQLGHFREPFSLEALTSSNWYTFLERGMNNTFDPSRNWGLMVSNHDESEMLTWAIGAFREGSDNFGDDIGDSGERAVTTRSTYLPYYDTCSDGRYFWEIGGSYSYRDPDNRFAAGPGSAESSIVRYTGRPQDSLNEDGVGSVPAFIDTGVLADVSSVNLFGIESSMNLGSLNFQGEYIASSVHRLSQDALLHGSYVQASWFATGESRQWNRKTGMFDRAQVYHPFSFKDGGRGALEFAVRWNYLDFGDLNAGYLDATTFGTNWYLNPYVRMMFNYEYVDLHDPADGRSDANVFHTRLDVHF